MAEPPKQVARSQSFSPARRWKIGFDTILRTFLVVAVIVMANYIGSLFPRQFFLSAKTRVHLSPHTISFLQTLTNRVDVTVYYDKSDGMFSTIMALLDEYKRIDPRISVNVVDYHGDPAVAAQVQQKYHLAAQLDNPNGPPEKNVVIFDLEGANPPRFKVAPGNSLVQFGATGMSKDKKIEFRPVAFNGEKMFTAMLVAITKATPFTCYYAIGDGEPSPANAQDNGYAKFTEILQENFVNVLPVRLSGDGDVPSPCDLLVIAGPQDPFSPDELKKIDHYLAGGGRLLALLDYNSIAKPTGLEDVLSEWGVNVGMSVVQDPNNAEGSGLIVQNFSPHPVVNALMQSKLEMIWPRPVSHINNPNAPANSPTVTELAWSSPDSVIYGEKGVAGKSYPLMVAVEQNSVKGIASANGGMRMIVAGDSLFLDNQVIEAGANRDFAGYAINWLLDRPFLLNGIGPSPVTEFRLLMTKAQVRNVRWLLLAALPGAVLVLGGLVWLRRRK